jgi:HEAT repeat protein
MQNRPATWNGLQVPYGASVEELERSVSGPIPARWAAFVALAHTAGERALAVLRESAHSSDPHARRAAVEAIGVHPEGGRAGDIMCRLLADTHDFVVRSACEAAARQQVAEAHDAILRLLDDEDESTRATALLALRELWKDTDFDRVFRVFASDMSTKAQKEAAWTLRSIASPSTWRQLFEVWRADSLPRHRQWACELAAAFGGREVLPDLGRLSNDVDGHVRESAVLAVRQVGAV